MSVLNKQINLKYDIIEKIECGVSLNGNEVKSIRSDKCSLKSAFALVINGEVILKNMHVTPYANGELKSFSEKRDRKLLLHKLEILKLIGYIKEKGYTLVPSKVYLKRNLVKVELCVCVGKKIYDKRDAIEKSRVKKQINEFKKV